MESQLSLRMSDGYQEPEPQQVGRAGEEFESFEFTRFRGDVDTELPRGGLWRRVARDAGAGRGNRSGKLAGEIADRGRRGSEDVEQDLIDRG